jgi:hypothetical protein
MTTPASFETAAARQAANIRKPLQGTVLLGKYGTAPVITSLVATGGQVAIPTTYKSVGWVSEDGLAFAKSRETSDVRGWGSASFLRRDIKSEDHTLQFTALETKQLTLELKMSRDLSAIQMSAGGEYKYDILDRPGVLYWRTISLGADGDGSTRFYLAKVYHKMSVTEMDDESWSDGDDPLQYNVTMSAVPDDVTGTLGTEFLFGPGALAAAAAMGITVAA